MQTQLSLDYRGSQSEQILAYLLAGNRLTPLDALRMFGSLRCGGRIFDLRKQGYDIRTEMVERNGKRFAEYWIEA